MVASLSVETDSVQISDGRGLGNWFSTITIAGSRNTRDSSRMHVPCLGIILLRKQSGKPYRTISKYNVFLLQRQHIGSLVVHARAIAHSRACRIREPVASSQVAFESLSHRARSHRASCIRELSHRAMSHREPVAFESCRIESQLRHISYNCCRYRK